MGRVLLLWVSLGAIVGGFTCLVITWIPVVEQLRDRKLARRI